MIYKTNASVISTVFSRAFLTMPNSLFIVHGHALMYLYMLQVPNSFLMRLVYRAAVVYGLATTHILATGQALELEKLPSGSTHLRVAHSSLPLNKQSFTESDTDKHGALLRVSFVLFGVIICVALIAWMTSLTCRCTRNKPSRFPRTKRRRVAAPRQFTKSSGERDSDVETRASTPHSVYAS
jgi:hypothetical protein